MALEKNPEQDFLGSIFMSLNLGNEHNGQFFTPYHVCELMAEVTMEDVVQKVKKTVIFPSMILVVGQVLL